MSLPSQDSPPSSGRRENRVLQIFLHPEDGDQPLLVYNKDGSSGDRGEWTIFGRVGPEAGGGLPFNTLLLGLQLPRLSG